MNDAPKVLVPFDRREACLVRDAACTAGVGHSTIRTWCEQHHIGRRVAGGPWQISRPALRMLLNGDDEALKRYLAGERFGLVAEHFAALGLRSVAQSQHDAQALQVHQGTYGASARVAAILPQQKG